MSERVEISDAPQFHTPNLTVEAWFTLRSITEPFRSILAKPFTNGAPTDTCDSWQIFYDQGELKGTVAACNTAMEYPWFPDPTAWHHVALTFDAAASREALYLDGVVVASMSTVATPLYDDNPVLIGADIDHSAFAGFVHGNVADVRIWSEARSPSQIQQDMVSCASGNEAGLIGAWPLDDGSGQIARDLGGSSLEGTLGQSATADTADPQWDTASPP